MSYFFILVLYNERLKDSKTFNSIKRSLLEAACFSSYLFVYDNSPESQDIDDCKGVFSGITYISDVDNGGLSIAYNKGVKLAEKLNYHWVILLDQDTDFEKMYLGTLSKAIEDHPKINLFAPQLKLYNGVQFSPIRYFLKKGHPCTLDKNKAYSLKKYSPVNSGLAIKVNEFSLSGGYVDNVKLDFADFQFNERFRKRNDVFFLLDAIGVQNFSNDEENLQKLANRFTIFLDCARACEKTTVCDYIGYFYATSRHCYGLVRKTKKIKFLKIYFQNYLFKK